MARIKSDGVELVDTTSTQSIVNKTIDASSNNIEIDTDSIPEGSSNHYFTDSRAQNASVVNSLSGNETNKAPSVSTVSTSLSLKVDKTTQINAGTGLTGGGDLSTNRTISLTTTGVTPSTYGAINKVPQFTVNAQGRITSASEVDIQPNILNYYTSVATSNTTTSSGTYSSLGIDISNPVAGTYMAYLTCALTSNVSGINNKAEIAISVGGSVIADSVRNVGIELSGVSLASATTYNAAATSTIITVNGSQNVSAMWRRSSGNTTHTAGARRLILIRIG